MTRARSIGLAALALVCTCAGVAAVRAEKHLPHRAALAAGAVVTFLTAVLFAVAALTRSPRP